MVRQYHRGYKQAKEKISDPAYMGFEKAMNTMPILQNPDSMRRLSGVSGLKPADMMRHIAHTQKNRLAEAKELQRKKVEARLAELEENTLQEN